MKFPRFHLSTLLLLCVFCGASVGLLLRSAAWQKEYFLPYRDFGGPLEPAAQGKFTFNLGATRLLSICNGQVYVFDLFSRRLLTKKLFNTPLKINRICLDKEGSVVHIQGVSIEASRGSQVYVKDWLVNLDGDLLFELPATNVKHEFLNNTVTTTNHEGHSTSEWRTEDGARIETAFADYEFSPGLVIICVDKPAPIINACLIHTGQLAESTRYSFDGQLLAIGHADGISVWRRVRSYGWIGYLELPLFWIALAALSALIAIFMRWLFQYSRRTRITAAAH